MTESDREKIELFRRGVIERIESGMFNAKESHPCCGIKCSKCGLSKDSLCSDVSRLVGKNVDGFISFKLVFNNINLESYLEEHPEYMI